MNWHLFDPLFRSEVGPRSSNTDLDGKSKEARCRGARLRSR
jgi:hypothetical protein